MIEVKNLTKVYGNLMAVNDISFKAEPGQILGFLGPNGAGKTTTMRIITGFMPATSGTVLIDGLDIFSQARSRESGPDTATRGRRNASSRRNERVSVQPAR